MHAMRPSTACVAFGLNAILFGTYYAVAKDVLRRVDPLVFTAAEQLALAPAAAALLWRARRHLSGEVVGWGVLLGTCLGTALVVLASGLAETSASATAFFPALSGVLAAVPAAVWRRRLPPRPTLAAIALSGGGALLLIAAAPAGGGRGTLLAALGTVVFTGYVLLGGQVPNSAPRPTLAGLELATLAVVVPLAALLWGSWAACRPVLPHDGLIVLYVAGACTLVPILLTVCFQGEVAAVTVAFIYTLEPVVGALLAHVYGGEALSSWGYAGGGLMVAGTLLHARGTRRRSEAAGSRRGARRASNALPACVG
jgi:drug/metabolite transporter (DMT)-like permease